MAGSKAFFFGSEDSSNNNLTGISMKSKEFSRMVQRKETRSKFIEHAIEFIRSNNFDGIDLGKLKF